MNETTYPPPANTPASTPEVPNHLAWAIISTVITTCLCCLPIGIVAIVFSSRVNGKLAEGDIEGARRDSENAKTWCWVTTGLGIFGLVMNIVFLFTGVMAEYLKYIG